MTEFDIKDITQGRLGRIAFYKKYSKYTKEGIMLDTAPLFLYLIGKLPVKSKDFLLAREFGYDLENYKTLKKFLKLCRIDKRNIKITPHILHELIKHFQNAYTKIKSEEEKIKVLNEFINKYLCLLKDKYYKEVCCWKVIKDERMINIEAADISFLIHAEGSNKKIALLTNDGDFYKEAKKNNNILAIPFGDILLNSDWIPDSLPLIK